MIMHEAYSYLLNSYLFTLETFNCLLFSIRFVRMFVDLILKQYN
jgi:hypothetical protein